MAPPGYPASAAATMAGTAKQPRKPIQPRQFITEQQHVTEDDLSSQMSLKDLLQQLHVTVEDLAALDSSLTLLFDGAPNTDVTEHQQLVQFRSRVARRISRYGQLTKGLAHLVEKVIASSSSQLQEGGHQKDAFSPRQLQELDALLKQHQQRLQKYKSQFAAWWQNTERHFHTMRMASYVCSLQERAQTASEGVASRDGAIRGPPRSGGPRVDAVRAKATAGEELFCAQKAQTAQDEPAATDLASKPVQPQQHTQQLLHETRQVMVQEVQRMQATQEQLQQSSGVLEQTETTYNGLRLIQSLFGSRSSSSWGAAHSSC